MSVVIRTAQDVAGNVGARIEHTTNRLLPPKQRERALENLRVFSVRNPKLAVRSWFLELHRQILTGVVISRSPVCPSWPTYPAASCLRHCNSCRLTCHLRTPWCRRRHRLHALHNRFCSPIRRPYRLHWQLYRQHCISMGTGWISGATTNQWR